MPISKHFQALYKTVEHHLEALRGEGAFEQHIGALPPIWDADLKARLELDGFTTYRDSSYAGSKFRLVAERSNVSLSAFGFAFTAFLFSEFSEMTFDQLKAFAIICTDCAHENAQQSVAKKWLPKVGGLAIFSAPVCVVSGISPSLSAEVANGFTTKFSESFAEVFRPPVAYDPLLRMHFFSSKNAVVRIFCMADV